MGNILRILKNWKEYKSWKAVKNGKKPINMERGPGYYFPTGLIGVKNRGRIEEIQMKSGRTAIAELIDYDLFSDPNDMIEKSFWHVSGYKGEKLLKDMTFKQYLKSAFNK